MKKAPWAYPLELAYSDDLFNSERLNINKEKRRGLTEAFV